MRRFSLSPLARWLVLLVLPVFALSVALMPQAASAHLAKPQAAIAAMGHDAGMGACPECDAAGDGCAQVCALCHVMSPEVAAAAVPGHRARAVLPSARQDQPGPRADVPSPPPRFS
ncbi:hypothetical protein [Lutimaribacter saemankumensis]|uniref:Uncharacterized protein n=1 Tax=Lutimaribacter saemankumensis TaxID=490829 RepID=A0A1G8MA65_9RHOB|nr:hypothetical protein [Lutimaribacter saemankumensis]SDI64250.1 hypothetical protein SAMN05421850_10489 [Lutimaribacter saemankumensis]